MPHLQEVGEILVNKLGSSVVIPSYNRSSIDRAGETGTEIITDELPPSIEIRSISDMNNIQIQS